MAQRLRQAIAISAPVETVFSYLDAPENSLALIPQVVEVRESRRFRTVAIGCASSRSGGAESSVNE